MTDRLPFELMEDPETLGSYQGWSAEVVRDLQALRAGSLSADAFDRKHRTTRALLVLDLTGFTVNALHGGSVAAFLRILDAQSVCLPVLQENGAGFIRTFADDVVALFDHPTAALDAALEIHRRMSALRARRGGDVAECCIGIGHGPVYAIGPNHAMGDEMNRASRLGEDTARGGETLVTEGAYALLAGRGDVAFERVTADDQPFAYYRVQGVEGVEEVEPGD